MTTPSAPPLFALAAVAAAGVSFETLEELAQELSLLRTAAAGASSVDTQHRAHVFEAAYHACLVVEVAGSRPPEVLDGSCAARAELLPKLCALAAWLIRYAFGKAYGWLPRDDPLAHAQCPLVLHALLRATTGSLLAVHAAGRAASPAALEYADSLLYGLSRLLLVLPGEPGEPRLREDAGRALLAPQSDALGGPPPGLCAALHACTSILATASLDAPGSRRAAMGCTLLLALSSPGPGGGVAPLSAACSNSTLAEVARPMLLLVAQLLGECWEGRREGGACTALRLAASRLCRALLRGRDARLLLTDSLTPALAALLGSSEESFQAHCGFLGPPPGDAASCVERLAGGLATSSLPREEAALLASLLALVVGAEGLHAPQLMSSLPCGGRAHLTRNLGALLRVGAHETRAEHLPVLFTLHGSLRHHAQ